MGPKLGQTVRMSLARCHLSRPCAPICACGACSVMELSSLRKTEAVSRDIGVALRGNEMQISHRTRDRLVGERIALINQLRHVRASCERRATGCGPRVGMSAHGVRREFSIDKSPKNVKSSDSSTGAPALKGKQCSRSLASPIPDCASKMVCQSVAGISPMNSEPVRRIAVFSACRKD
jgi:hypothetical protein